MKKNRKFIKKIIFSLLLLLCVCVPFLVHKSNVKAETNITDLTGMTVTVPAGWTATNTYGSYNINGTLKSINTYNLYEFQDLDTIYIGYVVSAKDQTFVSQASGSNIGFRYYYNDTLTNGYFQNTSSLVFMIIGGNDVTNQTLIQWFVDNNATFSGGSTPEEPEVFDLTLEEYEENDISFSSSSNFYYSINNTGFFVPLVTSETNLPYTIFEVSLITFENENIENDLVLYNRVTLPVSILTIVEPGQQYTLEITEDLTLWLGQAPSDNPIPPTPGETNVVSGGYRFNTLVSSSIFGDINEQELDILFEENFYLYNDTSQAFDMFTLHTENSDGTGAQYFCYENSLSGFYVRAGVVSSDKSYISIYSSYRTIQWDTQYVSPEVYTYLIDNGNFGDYEIPPSEPSPDNPLGWLIDNVNDFLQIEILPGLPIIWLIQFALIVPLCMIVLKMYFGG